MNSAAGTGGPEDRRNPDGGIPDAAHFPDAAWTGQGGGFPAYDRPTEPVPVDWQERAAAVPPAPGNDTGAENEAGAGPSAPGNAPGAAAPERRASRRRNGGRGRGMIVAWGVAGALVLGAVGFAVAGGFGGDGDGGAKAADAPAGITSPAPDASGGPVEASPSASATAPGPATGAPTKPPSTRPPGTTKPPTTPPVSSAPGPGTAPDGGEKRGDPDVHAPKDPSALTPAAYSAYRRVKSAMAADGITLQLESGKRSYDHQQALWEEEVETTGSEEAALHRVLPAEKSMHVHGLAVDIYPASAQKWLLGKGSAYGWCRLYDNEAWHFEYAAVYKNGCPARKAGPWE